ncbi:MAG TPA: hypothetical protein VHD63_03800 [Ktedonobacteraceae bacterium]|nr:hypothetical protein [Ktedonobacteraceae bacterium]
MTNMPDEFFQPEKVDEQIERLFQQPLTANGDAELIAYLRRLSATNDAQERETLNRMWARIAHAQPGVQPQSSGKGTIIPMQEWHSQGSAAASPHPKNRPWARRLGLLVATLALIVLVGGMTIVFNAAHSTSTGSSGSPGNAGGPGGGHPTTPATAATQKAAPFQVIGVDMAVSPSSIAGMSCGSTVTVKYTATFHVAAHSAGGTIHFSYTVNNGRSQAPASLTFAPGETTKSYTFSWQGALPADHTYPGQGGVEVTSPNHLISRMVAPSGSCASSGSAFTVLSVGLSVSPTSVAGLHCGASLVVTYTATFHVAANSPGGTIHFEYTLNNGRSSTPASLTFQPGQTTGTYTFKWSGNLPADHTYPEPGGIITSSPNTVNSPLVGPTGQCN